MDQLQKVKRVLKIKLEMHGLGSSYFNFIRQLFMLRSVSPQLLSRSFKASQEFHAMPIGPK